MSHWLATAAMTFLFASTALVAGDKYIVLHRCADGLLEISAWPPLVGNHLGGKPMVAAVQGKVLALVETDREIGLWSLSNGKRFQRIEARAEQLALHPSLPILATAADDVVTIWCREKRNGVFLPHEAKAVGKVSWIGFTPGGAPIVGTENGHLEVFHLSGTHTEKKIPVRTEIEIQRRTVAFHDEIDDSFSVVRFLSLRAFPLFKGPVEGAVKADSHGFWAAFSGNEFALWRWQGSGVAQSLSLFRLFPDDETITAASFSGNGETLALGSSKGKVAAWDTLKRAEIAQTSFSDAPITGMQLDENGSHALVGQGGKSSFCEIQRTGESPSIKMLFSTEQSKHVLNGPIIGNRNGLM